MTGDLFAAGPCYGCGALFHFNPDAVPSILVDPRSGLPADHIHADPTTPAAEYVRKPLCPQCVDRVEKHRRDTGQAAAWPTRESRGGQP